VNEPKEFTQGDSLSWTESFDDYPASAGWELHYVFVTSAADPLDVTAAANGDAFNVSVASEDTAALDVGNCSIQGYVLNGTERHTVSRTSANVLQDMTALAAGADTRSHYQKVLDAVNAVIEGRATQAEEEYSIAGRSLRRTPLNDLKAFKMTYERLLEIEQAKQDIKDGKPAGQGIAFTFQNPQTRVLPY
jgi:hypothetical protein